MTFSNHCLPPRCRKIDNIKHIGIRVTVYGVIRCWNMPIYVYLYCKRITIKKKFIVKELTAFVLLYNYEIAICAGLVEYTLLEVISYNLKIFLVLDFEEMSEMFHFEQFDFGEVPDKYSSSKNFGRGEEGNITKQTRSSGTEYWGESGDVNSFCSDLAWYQDNTAEDEILLSKYERDQQLQLFTDFGSLDDLYFDIVSPPFQSCQDDITKLLGIQSENLEVTKSKKEKPHIFPSASLEILKNYESGVRRLNVERIYAPSYDTTCTKVSGQRLSTDAILRLAGVKFMQSCSQSVDDISLLSHPFASSFLGLIEEEIKMVDLVQCLLASAEKIDQQQFDRARKLLDQCDELCSNTGNPVERVVYYFSKTLREKIDRETGKITKDLEMRQSIDIDEAMRSPNSTSLACHKHMPFCQIGQFAGMQAIIESLGAAKKVHLIDLEIRNGVQCTILMQALATRYDAPIELLKITTAVGTKSRQKIEETGKRLESFAQTLNLPFSFKVIMVSNMLDLNEQLFELEAEETVAVYCPYFLRTMLQKPKQLDHLMRVIRRLDPCIMVAIEVEANLNSPVFVKGFIEALFFYGTYFDCLEDCMEKDDPNRMIIESEYFGDAIRIYVAAEGEERTIRHVKIDVWKAFFAHFGMVEIELSMSSLYQASLLLKNFACGSSCTLDMDGKCLLIGWKGTPLHSLSAWKFL